MSYLEFKEKIPTSCKLVAVSKLQSEERVRALYQQGQKIFAENYVQEAVKKLENLSDLQIEWHFIGRLQSNKVKQIAGKFALIHSVDRFSLAETLDKASQKLAVRQKILLQVNIANEEAKAGWQKAVLLKDIEKLSSLKNLEIIGLMTMPPLFDDPEKSRPYFQSLKNLRDELKIHYANIKELSMGTSSDYSIAIEEGATFVRIGTLLFGERPK